jgi:predicted nucleotidyltransferase
MIKFGSKLPKDILMKAVDKLPEVFKKRPDIVAGYIYGSHATGKTTDLSDIE